MAFLPVSITLELFFTIVGIYFIASNEDAETLSDRIVIFQQRLIATFLFLAVQTLFLIPQVTIVDGTSIVTVNLPTSILTITSVVYAVLPLISISKLILTIQNIVKTIK